MNVWETLVDSTNRGTLVGTLASLDEVSQNLAPIDLGLDKVLNRFASISTD